MTHVFQYHMHMRRAKIHICVFLSDILVEWKKQMIIIQILMCTVLCCLTVQPVPMSSTLVRLPQRAPTQQGTGHTYIIIKDTVSWECSTQILLLIQLEACDLVAHAAQGKPNAVQVMRARCELYLIAWRIIVVIFQCIPACYVLEWPALVYDM